MATKSYRIETDSINDLQLPEDASYGIFTQRVLNNFGSISGLKVPELFLNVYIRIKKSYAIVNNKVGKLDDEKAKAILKACDYLLNLNRVEFMNNFPIDRIQGGGGSATNMIINEVIANTAEEILGGKRGEYRLINPNDHVNMSQSTNDTFPSASKITTIIQIKALNQIISQLVDSFSKLHKKFSDIQKVGRTHLQDAVTMTLGEEFGAFENNLRKELNNFIQVEKLMHELNLGATAIGSKQNVDDRIRSEIIKQVTLEFSEKFTRPKDYFAVTSSTGDFEKVSSALSSLCITLTKICNDLRLLASGPKAGLSEITLPEVQAGSSIMPGKVNPSIIESLNIICFDVLGKDYSIKIASQNAQLQLQVFCSLIAFNLFDSFKLITKGISVFNEKCVKGIKPNLGNIKNNYENSFVYATDYTEKLGYAKVANLVKYAYRSNLNLRNLLEKEAKNGQTDKKNKQ